MSEELTQEFIKHLSEEEKRRCAQSQPDSIRELKEQIEKEFERQTINNHESEEQRAINVEINEIKCILESYRNRQFDTSDCAQRIIDKIQNTRNIELQKKNLELGK